MRAHAQPHLCADQPAYISSCHTRSGSLTNWLSPEAVQHLHQVDTLSASPSNSVSEWRSRLRGWSPHVVGFSALVHLPTAWNLGRRKVGWIPNMRTYEEWASYPVDVLQLVCSQVGLAPAGSKHEMARRLVGFFQLAGAGAAGGPGTSSAGGNAGTWSPSAAPVASVPAAPPPVAHSLVPPFQFARLGLAAEMPDEVIQPFHDLAQEVVPLRGDELTSFFRDAIRREAIALAQAWSVPPASCAAAPVTAPTLLPPAPPAAPPQSTSPPHLPRFSLSLRPCHTPPPLGEVTHRYVC